MFEIVILKFQLVLLMILTIPHVQYVSAVFVDIRPLHVSP
jgi:hypothetical protein